jgi:hypothetical protein
MTKPKFMETREWIRDSFCAALKLRVCEALRDDTADTAESFEREVRRLQKRFLKECGVDSALQARIDLASQIAIINMRDHICRRVDQRRAERRH